MSETLMNLEEVAFGSSQYDELLQLRFTELREPLGLAWSDCELEGDREERHFGLYSSGQLVGVLALRNLGDDSVKLRQVATVKKLQGKGFGRRLMDLVEVQLVGEGVTLFELNSRVGVKGFYEKLGYEQEGEVFEEIGIPHVKMRKKL